MALQYYSKCIPKVVLQDMTSTALSLLQHPRSLVERMLQLRDLGNLKSVYACSEMWSSSEVLALTQYRGRRDNFFKENVHTYEDTK